MGSIYLYPVWIRLWHLANAILYLLLIITGLSMQYADPEYPLIRFDIAVSTHNISGILLTANYLWFLLANPLTGNSKFYRFDWKKIWKGIGRQFHYYTVGMFKGEKTPYPLGKERKFNPLQKIAYKAVIYILMPFLFITGWALIFPEIIFVKRIFATSGLHLTDLIHIVVGFIVSLFMIIHIYMCTITKPAGSSYRAMISGWHHSEEEQEEK